MRALVCLLLCAGLVAADVPRGEVFETGFDWASATYANPWEAVRVELSLRSPSGRAVTVGGFRLDTDRWAARFAPDEVGSWSWRATISDGTRERASSGVFTCVASTFPGFVRIDPADPSGFVCADGSAFRPLGIGDVLSLAPGGWWGFDGRLVDADTYFAAYAASGVNLFRWSVDNCAPKLWEELSPAGNRYALGASREGDDLVKLLRRHGLRVWLVPWQAPPWADQPTPEQFASMHRYLDYVVARWGAYVDFWELMNESWASREWHEDIGAYLRRIDPYRHPIGTSWENPGAPGVELCDPHWYTLEDELDSDLVAAAFIRRARSAGKPVVISEHGNELRNWDERSGLRMRLRLWAALFSDGSFIFWNTSIARDYQALAGNIWLGPEERRALAAWTRAARALDAAARPAPIVCTSGEVRAYALGSPHAFVAYLVHATDHRRPVAGTRIRIAPAIDGTAAWIDPATGEVLAEYAVPAGEQTLTAPPFAIDVALLVSP